MAQCVADPVVCRGWWPRYSVYLHFTCVTIQSTNTDANAPGTTRGRFGGAPGTQFTCFSSTKVRILTHGILRGRYRWYADGGGSGFLLSLLALLVLKYEF